MGLRVGVVTGESGPEAGGAWTFTATLIEAIETAPNRHTFVLLDRLSGNQQKPNKRWGSEAVLQMRRCLGLFRLKMSEAEKLESLARTEQIDLIWFLKPSSAPLRIPYIATVWDLEHRSQPYFPEVSTTGWSWSERESVYNALLPRASMIITGTKAGKAEVAHYYRVNPANIMVVAFPAPIVTAPAQPAAGLGIKGKYSIRSDFLLYPAQFWPHKNHVNLLRALKLLREQYNLDLSLVLTGSDKGNREHVMKEIIELGLGNYVFVLGFIPREDLVALYQAATALTFAGFFGPDNFPPMEAFGLGCPVVASKVAGAEEQMGAAALLFDPGDPSDIAEKIASLYSDPALRGRLIKEGYEIAKVRTPQAYIDAICSFLDRFETIKRCWGANYEHT